MKLNSLKVENWRNIESLHLSRLEDLVVAHGPNGTGKTSIAQAIRAALLDFDHDSGDSLIRESIPWNSSLIPSIELEFTHQGQRYSLSKRFHKTKEGGASLKILGENGEWLLLHSDKEASREVRKFFQVRSTREGLFQLLWHKQGASPLDEKLIDQSLSQQIQQMIGSLLTPQDFRFLSQLEDEKEKRYTTKFEPRKGTTWWERLEDRKRLQQRFEDLKRRNESASKTLAEYDRIESLISHKQQALSALQMELNELEEHHLKFRAKDSERKIALSDYSRRLQELKVAEEKLEQRKRLEDRSRTLETELARAEGMFKSEQEQFEKTQDRCAQRRAESETAKREAEEARSELTRYQNLKRYSELLEMRNRSERELAQIGEHDNKLVSIQRELNELRAPDPSECSRLRKNREEWSNIRFELSAEEWRIRLIPLDKGTISVTLDEQAREQLELDQGDSEELHVRHHAELHLPGWGSIEVRRGSEKARITDREARLETLDREFQTALTKWRGVIGDSCSRENLLDQLTSLLEQKRSLETRLGELKADRSKRSENDTAKLRNQLNQWNIELGELRSKIELGEVDPSSIQLRLSEATLLCNERSKMSESFFRGLSQAEQEYRDSSRKLENSERGLEETKNRLQELRRELEGMDSLLDYLSRKEQAKREEQLAHQQIERSHPTSEELEKEKRLDSVRREVEALKLALNDLRLKQRELAGELQGNTSISSDSAQAEADLESVNREIEDAEEERDAYRFLLETFNSCRREQVLRTTELIEDRVLEDAKFLGMNEWSGISLNDQFLPESIRKNNLSGEVSVHKESYGTVEQLTLLIRLAIAGILAQSEPQLILLDDPLTHSDRQKLFRMLSVLERACEGYPDPETGQPTTGRLQILILTCHPDRYEALAKAQKIKLSEYLRPIR